MKRLLLLAVVAVLLSYGPSQAASRTTTAATAPKPTFPATAPTAPKATDTSPGKSSSPSPTRPTSTASQPDMLEQPRSGSDEEMARNAPQFRIGMRGVGGRGQPVAPPPPNLNPEPKAKSEQSDWVWLAAAVGAVLLAVAGTLVLVRRSKPPAPTAPTAYDPYA